MEKLTIIQKLDEVLKYIQKNELNADIDNISIMRFLDTISVDEKSNFTATRLVNKLKDDGFLYTTPYFSVSVEGLLFISKGGYSTMIERYHAELEIAAQDKVHRIRVDNALITNNHRMRNLTIGLLIASIAYTLIALTSILLPYILCPLHCSK